MDTAAAVYNENGRAITNPCSFTVPQGSYTYSITLNRDGLLDLSGTSSTDSMKEGSAATTHLAYTGYMRVDAYTTNPGNESAPMAPAPEKTIWIKLSEDSTSFNFKPGDYGLGQAADGSNYALVLTYYAKPSDTAALTLTVQNNFKLSNIGSADGDFSNVQIDSSSKVTLAGEETFSAKKSF